MHAVLLADIGSTYTKVVAVDLNRSRILGTGAAPTTVDTDISQGLFKAMASLSEQIGPLAFAEAFASSSAAGGLKMVTIGLVPELTARAGKLAAANAGAKVIGTYSYELSPPELEEIQGLAPEIILLCGGTDGGNKEVILHNARLLSKLEGSQPVVVAGNKVVSEEIEEILKAAGKVRVCENVMPRFNSLNIRPAQEAIREIFLENIVEAKGLGKVQEFIGNPLVPTPVAVLKAAELLAIGSGKERGLGELMVVDVGGATVDVYTMAEGIPKDEGVVFRGLPEPFAKRTVEGDLGLRYSARSTVEAIGQARVQAESGLNKEELADCLKRFSEEPGLIAEDEKMAALDRVLTRGAVRISTRRHAGKIEAHYTPCGLTYVQTGKDLTSLRTIIGTGGPLVKSSEPVFLLGGALSSSKDRGVLKPERCDLFIDRSYILASMGLLAEKYPEVALKILKQELEWVK
jgi:uncharacterized protein (TIGR01319 family)